SSVPLFKGCLHVKLNEPSVKRGVFPRCLHSAAMSDAIQFLMERDRTSSKIAENPRKTRVFAMAGAFPGISPRESQRKNADFLRFLRQFAQARTLGNARFPCQLRVLASEGPCEWRRRDAHARR